MRAKKRNLGIVAFFIAFAVILSLFASVFQVQAAQSKGKYSLNKKKVVVCVSKKYTQKLKVKGAKGKKIKWSSSNKKVVRVTKSGKLRGLKKGKAIIKARIGKKTLKCKVTVKKHAWKRIKYKKPICGVRNGYKKYKCKYCGRTYKKTVKCKKAHKYKSKLTRKATCSRPGIRTYTCSRCKIKYKKCLPVKKHKYVNGVCKVCGVKKSSEKNYLAVSADGSKLTFTFHKLGKGKEKFAQIIRVNANDKLNIDNSRKYLSTIDKVNSVKGSVVDYYQLGTNASIKVNRYTADGYDTLYCKYYIVYNGKILKGPVYVSEIKASRTAPDPASAKSIKGIFAEGVDESAVTDLNCSHAVMDFDATSAICPNEKIENGKAKAIGGYAGKDCYNFNSNGRTYYFRRSVIRSYDKKIKSYTDAGMAVSLIVVARNVNDFDEYPQYLVYGLGQYSQGGIIGFNTSNAYGRDYWIALMEFLGQRYSRADGKYGRVDNYVIGNEIDLSKDYYRVAASSQKVSLETYMEEYIRTLRLASQAVNKYCSGVSVTMSLTHAWASAVSESIGYYSPKEMVDYLAERSKAEGDFDWGISPHCYGMSLAGSSVAPTDTAFTGFCGRQYGMNGDYKTSKLLTFSNLELLQQYMEQPSLKYKGRTRRVYLTEQGVSSFDNSYNSQQEQACYLAAAYYKAANLSCITAFDYYRLIDNETEIRASARFGLEYEEKTSDGKTIIRKKPAYDLYRYIDTDHSFDYSQQFLPVFKYTDDSRKEHSSLNNWKEAMGLFGSGFDWNGTWKDSNIQKRSQEPERSLTLEKNVPDNGIVPYAVGEKILVTAEGAGQDKVAIYKKSDDYKNNNVKPIYWYYVNGKSAASASDETASYEKNRSSGVACDIREGVFSNTRSDCKGLPAGEYTIYLFKEGTQKVAASVNIRIGSRSLTTDKDTYQEGMKIMVTAQGEGKDWVGIYRKGDKIGTGEGTVPSIYWYYVSDGSHTSGKAYDIRTGSGNGRSEDESLPAGDYTVYLFQDDGYAIAAQKDIHIEKSEVSLDVEKSTLKYEKGQAINITASCSSAESGDWVGIYRKSDDEAKIKAKEIQSIYWYYVKDHNNEPFNIKDGELNDARKDLKDLPAGTYMVDLLDADYNILQQKEIVIRGLSTDKDTYEVGEKIMVTAGGTATAGSDYGDWVGIYAKNDKYGTGDGTVTSIYWYYVDDDNHISGNSYNISKQEYNNDRAELKSLPAGEYSIYLFSNGGYDVIAQKDITIKASETPVDKKLELDKSSYNYQKGQKVTVTATGSSGDWVGIYASDDDYKEVTSIYWYYVTDHNGEVFNIKEGEFNDQRSALKDLIPGNYTVYLFDKDQNVLARKNLVIKGLRTDKTEYSQGDDIRVTAYGSDSDWTAIYKEGEKYGTGDGTVTSIYWYYADKDSHSSGDTCVLQKQTLNEARSGDKDLPAGKYTIYLFENDGYNVIDKVDIEIKNG